MERDKLEQSLQKKGFKMDDKKDHRYFHLVVNGKRPGISTKTSHGSKKYKTLAGPLQSAVKKQLKLDTSSQLKDFVDCPLSYENYLDILKEKGLVVE